LLEPRRIVALERQPAAILQLQDPLGDVIEEVTIVSNDYDCAVILAKGGLEPLYGLGVEVVCRLVKKQDW